MRLLSLTALLFAVVLPAFSQTVPVQFIPSEPGVLEIQFKADDPAAPQDEVEILREFTNDPPTPVTIALGNGEHYMAQGFQLTDAPAWARVSFLRFRIDASTDRPGDHDLFLSSAEGNAVNEDVLIWDGALITASGTDAGLDDDAEDDTDIFLDWRGYTEFNGEPVNQGWAYFLIDVTTPNVSTVNSYGFQIFYRAFDNSLCNEVTEIPFAECSALVDLYNDTNGDDWTNYDGWMTTTMPCSWYGVSCRDGQVRGIDLRSNNLTGTLPTSFADLSGLEGFVFFDNNIEGSIPPEFGNMTNVDFFDIRVNNLSGTIPASIGNLTRITWLGLDVNNLEGEIPESIGNLTNLAQLFLNSNNLSGVVPLSVAQRCAEASAKQDGVCNLTGNNETLCIPDTAPYQAIGVNPLGGLPLIPNCGNQAPVAQADAVNTAFETAIDIDVLANDSDSNNDALTISAIIRAPSSGTVLITNNQIRYTPNAGFEGTDTFSYEVSDGQAAAEATVTVNVGSNPAITGTIRFRVDVTREIALGNIRSGLFVGVRGSLEPLSWDVTAPLSDSDGDGVFTGTISFTQVPGTVLEYKFVYESADGSTVAFEGNVGDGGEFGNRTHSFAGSVRLPLAFWNNVTGVATEDEQPHGFALGQNYPNPFNPTTRIRYTLPHSGAVTLHVYDSQGRLVRTLVDGVVAAGEHHATLEAGDLPSGVYFYTLRTAAASATRAFTLMK
ncbi:MAG: Ig-like domain-containing protein [Bacteroidota bacterium]